MPYLDVKNTDPAFAPYQRIGATGILKGEGKSVAWSNETWLYADSVLTGEAIDGFYELYPQTDGVVAKSGKLTVGDAAALISAAADKAVDLSAEGDADAAITRGRFAVVVDSILDPFNAFPVDINGNFR